MGGNDHCCVLGCQNRRQKCRESGDKVSFCRFPMGQSTTAQQRRAFWLRALRRKDFTPTRNSRVCGLHFVGGFSNNDPSSVDYVPTLNLGHEKACATAKLSENSQRTAAPNAAKADAASAANIVDQQHLCGLGAPDGGSEESSGGNRELSSGDTSGTEETDTASLDGFSDRNEMTDQMYEEELSALKHRLEQLEQGTLPAYVRRLQELREEDEIRSLTNLARRDFQLQIADMEYQKEVAAAEKEFEEKRTELMETLIRDLEKEKRQIELEESMSIDDSSDGKELRPGEGRKLRRRPSDIPEKKRVASVPPVSPYMDFMLSESELKEDLDFFRENLGSSPPEAAASSGTVPPSSSSRSQQPTSSSSNGSISSRVKLGRTQVKK